MVVSPNPDILVATSYRLYMTLRRLDRVAEAAAVLENATLSYGIGNWHLYGGHRKLAETVFRTILQGPQWAAFGYIAAGADLHRLGG